MGLSDRSGTVDYTIVVPTTANLSRLQLRDGEVLVDGMSGETVRARLRNGTVFAHNCFSNVEFTLDRGTLTLAHDWWEPRKFSIQANIALGNAWAVLPSDAAFHLIAKAEGKISSDFESTAPASNAPMQIDALVNGGGDATIKVRVAKGNIKIIESNP